ncbi:hypothetical protein QAD02_001452 [Eretmocerus hayati]|uniref:Uncharacterized protein n=1 Tax=Eretmocerus hayati TaxID=131215 RepID=A0ACC2NGA3_9HYME|nr:hypothetical protein QAD02_001452 [Eretmocerus hayati]
MESGNTADDRLEYRDYEDDCDYACSQEGSEKGDDNVEKIEPDRSRPSAANRSSLRSIRKRSVSRERRAIGQHNNNYKFAKELRRLEKEISSYAESTRLEMEKLKKIVDISSGSNNVCNKRRSSCSRVLSWIKDKGLTALITLSVFNPDIALRSLTAVRSFVAVDSILSFSPP